ncbi:MAG: threonine--tRNA ligase, partial [archaeon]|nr:threonine--tRNA ligase [archaeon]
WEKFGEHNMYNLNLSEDQDDKPTSYTLKPMNCPESTILYRFRPRSYKELPLRLSEIGRLHRKEKSGEVNGLLRVRQITMDDAHIYARENQIMEEVSKILDIMMKFYKIFNFEYEFRLATRPELFAGTENNWEKAEKALEEALNSKKLEYIIKEKDGAFYGPKIDMHIKDSLGRDWQMATVQLDFHMPQAFDLKYTNEKGEFEKPVMIHRAIFGSFERFIGILTEHFQGAFPTWLSPVQVQIVPITDRNNKYGQNVLEQLKSSNIRVELDDRGEKMQGKIRDAQLQKIPYMLIIGDREEKEEKIAVRTRDGKDLGAMSLEEFAKKIKDEIESRS